MTGLIVLTVALVLALAFGLYRRRSDGRVDAVHTTHAELDGYDLGQRATLVQFSTPLCAPCGPTRELLKSICADRPGVAHIEVDATEHLDLVQRFSVRRTPTVLVLDGDGQLRHRVTGVPKVEELELALDDLCAVRA